MQWYCEGGDKGRGRGGYRHCLVGGRSHETEVRRVGGGGRATNYLRALIVKYVYQLGQNFKSNEFM